MQMGFSLADIICPKRDDIELIFGVRDGSVPIHVGNGKLDSFLLVKSKIVDLLTKKIDEDEDKPHVHVRLVWYMLETLLDGISKASSLKAPGCTIFLMVFILVIFLT